MATISRGDQPTTIAQRYCLLAGAVLLIAGVAGFLADASFDTTAGPAGAVEGDKLLIFEVNGWHNVVHLLSGAVLLAAAGARPAAKAVALGFGLVYGVVAIIGLIDGDEVLGIIPVNGADHVLHVALAAAGIAAGLVSAGSRDDQARRDAGTGTGRVSAQ